MQQIDKKDVQGIILKGYSDLPAAAFVLLRVANPSLAKQWIKGLVADVTPGDAKPTVSALNAALTFEGLKALGLPQSALDSFPIELEDGMTTPHKQLLMGDFGTSDPATWEWGGRNSEGIHIMLMMYAADDTVLDAFYTTQKGLWEGSGLREVRRLGTSVLSRRKEHFGFHDGIAQPTIAGLDRKDSEGNTVATGEFILGYPNEYDQYPDTPLIADKVGNSTLLPDASSGMRNLGMNGSYLVFRQMEQDVQLFWKYMEEATAKDGAMDKGEMIRLASKMVGRWPSGAPICLTPENDDESMENKDSFAYRHGDPEGLKCPIGSHVRRTNPRDAMDTDIKASVKIANKHRILRRGRSYGKPVCESLNPEDILTSKNFEGERGLHFICFNADIGRQFEFIQNAWVNNPKLSNLYNERDPIIGNNHHPEDEKGVGVFSIPRNGLRKRYQPVPEFVRVKGGAYFFMPGIRALEYLSTI